MALQFTPALAIAARYGAVAMAGFVAARLIPRGRLPRAVADEMDKTPIGLRLRKERGEVSSSVRGRHIWRITRVGPRLRLDATALARVKLRVLP